MVAFSYLRNAVRVRRGLWRRRRDVAHLAGPSAACAAFDENARVATDRHALVDKLLELLARQRHG
jgi:hypothetical protein